MLKRLRSRKVMKRILQITLFLVIPSFVVFYGWSQKMNVRRTGFYFARMKYPGMSRWSTITEGELRFAKNTLATHYAQMLGVRPDRFNQMGLEKYIPTYDIVLEAIDNRILLNYASKANIIVTGEEIKNYIRAMFPQNTAANLQRYLNLTRQSEAQFVRERETQQTLDKAKYLFLSQAKTSLFELWQEYLIAEEKLKIDYVKFPVEQYLDKVEVGPEDLQTYFQEHIENYRVPNQVNYEYVLIAKSDLETSVTVTAQEVRDYYNENKAKEFTLPKRVKARHILISVAENADKETVQAAEQKVQEIAKRLKQGEDFATLANKYSNDPRNVDPQNEEIKRGGEVGWISEKSTAWEKPFIDAAIALKPGEVSKPVRTSKGFHIIKADEVKESSVQPFDEVKEKIRSSLTDKKASALLKREAARLQDAWQKYTTLDSMARALNLPMYETGLVNEDVFYFKKIGSLIDFRDVIAGLKPGEMSDVLVTPSSCVILQIKEQRESHLPSLKEVEDRVRQDYRHHRAEEMARQDAQAFAKQAPSLEEMKKLAKERGLSLETTKEYFTRMKPPEGLKDIQEFARTTLRTPVGSISVSPLGSNVDHPEAFVVWYLKEKQPPDREEFKKALPQLQREYLAAKRPVILNEYLADARNRIKVDINPQLLPSQ
jgi:peptidyl-prolyl cis-trans isomerase D